MTLWRLATAAGSFALLTISIVLQRELIWLAAPVGSTVLLALGSARGQRWTVSVWFAAQMLTIAVIGEPALPLLLAALLALAHSDLESFVARLSQAPTVFDRQRLTRRHLTFLLSALLLGGGLAAIALLGTLQLAFAPAAALVILALIGLNRLLRAHGPPQTSARIDGA